MARGERRVIVANRAGEEYSVPLSAFHSIYEPRGFTIARNEDGSKYTGKAGKAEGPSMAEARAEAKALGLSAGGSREAILARIAAAKDVPETPAPVTETAPA